MHYLLPHAALKLKQGFGRLIRSRQDMGVVVLLDSRVVTKRYGPLLLGGLPRAERIIGSWAQVRTKCEDFFARHGHRGDRVMPVAPVEDRLRRPQLRGARQGAGQRGARRSPCCSSSRRARSSDR